MRRTLAIASSLLTFLLAMPSQARADYQQPRYVEALMKGEAERMAAEGSNGWVQPADEARLFFQVHGNAQMQKLEPRARAIAFELAKSELHHSHRRIFRTAYAMAMARTLSQRCPFLEERVLGGVGATLAAMSEWSNLDPRRIAGSGPSEASQAEHRGQVALAAAMAAGDSDAKALVPMAGCADITITQVQATLRVLFSYGGGTDRHVPDVAPDYSFLLQGAGRYVRHDLLHELDEAALGSRAAVRHLPSVDEEVAGVLVGWTTDARAAFEASTADGRTLLVLYFADTCYPCSAQIQELMTSPEFNALAGQFRALLLIGARGGQNMAEVIARKFNVQSRPAVSLVQIEGGEARELMREEGYNEGQAGAPRLAKQISHALGVKSHVDREAWARTAPVRNMMPAACWKIESYPLCMLRLRRSP